MTTLGDKLLPVVEIAVTYMNVSPGEKFKRVGKLAAPAYIWARKGGKGEPLTAVRVVAGDANPGEGFTRIDIDLANGQGQPLFLWVSTSPKAGPSPLVDVKVMEPQETIVGPGFVKVLPALGPKEFLCVKTKDSQVKIDNSDYAVGDFIDAKDTAGHWMQGRIVEINNEAETYFVHFEGWADKWNEWIPKKSQKIAPHLSQTQGKNTGYHGDRAAYDLTKDEATFERLEKLMEDAKPQLALGKELSPEMSAFLKTENPKFVEKLLNALIDSPSLLIRAQAYIQNNLDIIIFQLKRDGSVSRVWLELLLKLFNGDPELQRYYRKYGLVAEGVSAGSFARREGKRAKPGSPEEFNASAFLIDNINYFGQQGGFTEIRTRLKRITTTPPPPPPLPSTTTTTTTATAPPSPRPSPPTPSSVTSASPTPPPPRSLTASPAPPPALAAPSLSAASPSEGKEESKGESKQDEEPKQDSFLFISAITHVLTTVRPFLVPEFLRQYVSSLDLKQIVHHRVSHITDEELKTLDKDSFGIFVGRVTELLLAAQDTGVDEFREQVQLDFAFRLLSSDVLEKRINGMAELQEAINRIRAKTQYINQRDFVPSRLTPEFMVEWLESHKIIPLVLGRGSHEQVVKRSPPILKFLASNNSLTVSHINLLWSSATEKHEELVRIVYDTLADVAQSLSDNQLEALYERIKEKPLSEYQEFDLQFLCTFTVNAVSASMRRQGPVKSWFGVDILWRMLQDDAKVPDIVSDLASVMLCNLLGQPTFASQKVVYLDKCLTGLQKGESSLQCLRLTKILAQMWEVYDNRMDVMALSDLIQTLEDKFSLLNLLLVEATRHNVQAQNYLVAKRDNDTNPNDFTLPNSRHSHSSHMTAILEFLDYILSNSSLVLLKPHLSTLWEVFVSRSVSSQDPKLLLQWLKACISFTYDKRRCKALSLEGVEYVFNDLLSSAAKLDLTRLPMDGYYCFESYFLHINSQAGFLQLPSHATKHMTVTDFNKLRGMNALWRMVEHCGVSEVAAASSKLLVTMHIRQEFQIQSKDRRCIFEKFISHIFKELQDMIKNLRADNADGNFSRQRTMRLVDTLNSFLSRCADFESMPKFVVGQKVTAHWKGQMQKTYSGTIAAVNPIGSYAVRFDDNDVDPNCPAEHIYPLDGAVAVPTSEDNLFPHHLLSNSDVYFNLIFELLSIPDIGKKIWSLLIALPSNRALESKIWDLPIHARDAKGEFNWGESLPNNAPIKLLYMLKIIEDRLSSGEGGQMPADMQEWCKGFISYGGFKHLYDILMTTPQADMLNNGPLPRQGLSVLLSLLHKFLKLSFSSKDSQFIDYDKLAGHVLTYVEALVPMIPPPPPSTPKAETKSIQGPSGGLLPTPANVKEPPPYPGNEHKGAVEVHPKAATPTMNDEWVTQGKLMRYCFALLQMSSEGKPATVIPAILERRSWPHLLKDGLVFHFNAELRVALRNGLMSLCKLPGENGAQFRIKFVKLLLGCLEQLDTKQELTTCMDFFSVLMELLDPQHADVDLVALARMLSKKIKEHPMEAVGRQDLMLQGLMALERHLFTLVPWSKGQLGGAADGLVEDLCNALFELPNADKQKQEGRKVPPPKCKTTSTRKVAFSLLQDLVYQNPAGLAVLITRLRSNHFKPHSGGMLPYLWDFESKAEDRSDTGYVGIRNLGCICYMNALLQQLFMIPKLRKNILSMDLQTVFKNEKELNESEVFQLQNIMGGLQESEKQYVNPELFCQAFKDFDGNPINVNVQEDLGGFLLNLFDKITEKLKDTPYKSVVNEVMGGVLSHELIGRNKCPHYREREEPFAGVTLEIKNKKTIHESLQAYIEGEVLEGGNQVNCPKCNAKVDTLKRVSFKKLPNTLVFVLKRFFMDYNTMQTVKLNDKLEFPKDLDMKPYSKEGQPPAPSREEDSRSTASVKIHVDGEDNKSDGKEKSADDKSDDKPEEEVKGPEYYKYKLRGVVVHQGSMTHGHYWSYIQERQPLKGDECRWFEFNDNIVRPFDPEMLEEECFGGMETPVAGAYAPSSYPGMGSASNVVGGAASYGPQQRGGAQQQNFEATKAMMEKSRNAYLLFYDRVVDDAKPEEPAPVPKIIHDRVAQSNLTYWRDKVVFDKQYFEFLYSIMTQDSTAADSSPNLRLEMGKLSTEVVLNSVSRAHDKETFPHWINLLRNMVAKDRELARFIITNMISQHNWNVDFLLHCLLADVRSQVGRVICESLTVLSPAERDQYFKMPLTDAQIASEKCDEKAGPVTQYIHASVKLFPSLPPNWKIFEQYFRVLAHFAELGPNEAQHLCCYNLLPKLMDFFMGDASPIPMAGIKLDSKGKRPQMSNAYLAWDTKDFLRLLKELILISEPPKVSKTRSPFSAQGPLFPLSAPTRTLLAHKSFFTNLLKEAKGVKSGTYVTKILANCCWDNEQLSQSIIAYMSAGLEENFVDHVRPYFRVMNGLVNIQDTLQDKRIEWVLSSVLSTMEMQQRFWKMTDMCIEHLIRTAKNNPKCLKYLSKQGKRLDWIITWLGQHPAPDRECVLYKPNRPQFWEVKNYPTGLSITRKRQTLEQIKDGKDLDNEGASDSDEDPADFPERVFAVGDWVDLADRNQRWHCAQVTRAENGRVWLQCDGSGPESIEELGVGDLRIRKSGKQTTKQQQDLKSKNELARKQVKKVSKMPKLWGGSTPTL